MFPGALSVNPAIALVGCGRRCSAAILPVLVRAGVRVPLIVDPDRRARERAVATVTAGQSAARDEPIAANALTHGVLARTRPGAVIIASPSGLHFEQAALALACGLPTFLEKPLACTAEQGRRLSLRGAGMLAVSEQRIHRTDLRLAQSLIASGGLGEIRSVEYRDSIFPAPFLSNGWRNDPRLAGGGILLDLGYHTIGALQWLLGRGHGVTVKSAELTHGPLDVESRGTVQCAIGDTEVLLDIGLTGHRPEEDLRVRGSRGEIRIVRDRREKYVASFTCRRPGPSETCARIAIDPGHDVRSLQDFLAGVYSADQLARHIRVLELLAAIYRTAKRGFPDAAEGHSGEDVHPAGHRAAREHRIR